MANKYDLKNLCFAGGGVFGIAYLGVLDYISKNGVYQDLVKVAGTSVGAVAACVTSFNLPFTEIKRIMDSLDYSQIPQRDAHSDVMNVSDFVKNQFEFILGDFDSIYRLLTKYGWYSTKYFYDWMSETINEQFDSGKKPPPYTFRDFTNPSIHKDKREFKDLFVVGTDISMHESKVFSHLTTPDMEVAEAIRISMSIPLYFESVKVDGLENLMVRPRIFSDGGVMWNYPINIFDETYFAPEMVMGTNIHSFGARFVPDNMYHEITNFLDYITNLIGSFTKIQEQLFLHNEADMNRSISINTGKISFVDFDIKPGDKDYNFLLAQGYTATKEFFDGLSTNPYYNKK